MLTVDGFIKRKTQEHEGTNRIQQNNHPDLLLGLNGVALFIIVGLQVVALFRHILRFVGCIHV